MRVFLDTNVIVSAVATRGLCADVFREVLVRHQLIISETLIDEVRNVLQGKIGVPPEFVSDVLTLLREGSLLSKPSPAVDLPIHDPEDKALISAALNGGADLFVTGDREILELSGSGTMEIVSPRMFWERAKAQLKSG
ncbi:MAG: putative toxin-antitoxin system toxin component, PIN family [Acidobacteria bacterium]|nr:putative toxin-antitoxin system toxin component, PIN family [Acidobacteriota bacterium]